MKLRVSKHRCLLNFGRPGAPQVWELRQVFETRQRALAQKRGQKLRFVRLDFELE